MPAGNAVSRVTAANSSSGPGPGGQVPTQCSAPAVAVDVPERRALPAERRGQRRQHLRRGLGQRRGFGQQPGDHVDDGHVRIADVGAGGRSAGPRCSLAKRSDYTTANPGFVVVTARFATGGGSPAWRRPHSTSRTCSSSTTTARSATSSPRCCRRPATPPNRPATAATRSPACGQTPVDLDAARHRAARA